MDAATLEELYYRHSAMVHAIVNQRVRNVSDADDITQGIFLKLANKPPSIPANGDCTLGRTSPLLVIHVAVRNTASNMHCGAAHAVARLLLALTSKSQHRAKCLSHGVVQLSIAT